VEKSAIAEHDRTWVIASGRSAQYLGNIGVATGIELSSHNVSKVDGFSLWRLGKPFIYTWREQKKPLSYDKAYSST
jgi:hypothetical protein